LIARLDRNLRPTGALLNVDLEPVTAMPAEVPINVANTFMRTETLAAGPPEALHGVIVGPDLIVEPDFAVLGTVRTGRGPIADIAFDTTGGTDTLVLTNYDDDSVSVIDAASLTVVTVAVGGEPFAATLADHRAYVGTASASHDWISVIHTRTKKVVATYPLALRVTAVAVDPHHKRVFVGATGRDVAGDVADLAIIDTTTDEVARLEIASAAGVVADAVRVGPDGRRVYVAVSDGVGGNLVVVDTDSARAIATVPIGSPIRDVAVSADGTTIDVLIWDPDRGGAVAVVDAATHEIAARIAVGGSGTQMTLSPDGTRAYIVDADQVAVVCTLTNATVDAITVDARPSCVAASTDGTRLYVADYAGAVTALSVAPAAWVYSEPLVGELTEARELLPAV
jgi:YVTN family beta-propeller protein